jgi:hypothetical protein
MRVYTRLWTPRVAYRYFVLIFQVYIICIYRHIHTHTHIQTSSHWLISAASLHFSHIQYTIHTHTYTHKTACACI